MATLSNISGRRMIQFPGTDGKRKTLRLGKIDDKGARLIRSHVDELIGHNVHRQPLPRLTSEWLADIGDDLYAKLVNVGLVKRRVSRGPVELAPFLDRYIAGRTDLKPRTILNLKQVRNGLVEHFGKRRDLTTINKGEIGDWRRGLMQGLATATVAMHVKKARQMFADAVDRKLIDDNPLQGVKAGSMSNDENQEYVPVADVLKAIDKCPDAEWRLIFALARYGGLRTPSEQHRLLWTDIRWDEGRMTIRSPKTEHHEGKATREVPIFPELVPYLREAQELAEDGAKHVIARNRGGNLGTQAGRIIDRAGLKQWSRMFQNLRSSRQTDLENVFPSHVVCAWMGNSEKVARKHYLQVTDEHFNRALQNALRSGADNAGQKPDTKSKTPNKSGVIADFSTPKGNTTFRRKLAKSLIAHKRALQKALHHTKSKARRQRSRDIDRLAFAVAKARPRFPLPSSPAATERRAEG